MYRRLFKLAVTSITILTLNLLTTKLSDFLVGYKTHYKPLSFTLIAMGIITLDFYPFITHLEEWLNNLSVRIVKSGRSLGGKYIGLLLVFSFCLFVLFCFYAKMWFNMNVVSLLLHGKIESQF